MCLTCALGAPGVGESLGTEVSLYAINGFLVGSTLWVAQRVADLRR